MTETSIRPAQPAPSPSHARRIYVAGGIGGIMAIASWLLQPLLVFVLSGDVDEDLFGTWEYYQTYPWNGLYEAVAFSGVGVGVLTIVVATTRLVRGRAPETSAFVGVGQALGMAAGTAWFLAAALSAAPYTSVGFAVNDFVPGADEQAALYDALALVLTSFLVLFALGMIGWLVSFGLAARRRGIIGWPLAIAAFAAAAVAVSALLVPFSPPWGMIGPLAYLPVLGIALLVKSRRA